MRAAVKVAPQILLAAGLLLAGCTDAGGAPDAGPDAAWTLSCNTNAECAEAGLVCDEIRRTCVCTNDSMCQGYPGTPYCNAFTGRCVADVAGCKSDRECGDFEFCDPALRACRSKTGWCGTCTQDAQCGGAGDFCVKHPDFPGSPAFCGSACGANDSCPAGQACRNTEKGKQCIPAVGRCEAGAGGTCNPDTGQPCQNDRMCSQGSGQICDLGLGRCIAENSGCASGQSCDPLTRTCVSACRTDGECQERYSSTDYQCVRNTCIRAETCYDDTACPPNKFCFKDPTLSEDDPGLCQPSCASDNECPLGERCVTNPQTARNRCVAGCISGQNIGCPLNAICVGGQCETIGAGGVQRCQVKEVCDFKQSCASNSCVPQPDHCKRATGGCGASGSQGTLFFQPVCGSGAGLLCPSGSSKQCNLNIGNQCVGCACRIERCLYRCTSDAQCPNGFYCIDGVVATNPLATYCYPTDPALCL